MKCHIGQNVSDRYVSLFFIVFDGTMIYDASCIIRMMLNLMIYIVQTLNRYDTRRGCNHPELPTLAAKGHGGVGVSRQCLRVLDHRRGYRGGGSPIGFIWWAAGTKQWKPQPTRPMSSFPLSIPSRTSSQCMHLGTYKF